MSSVSSCPKMFKKQTAGRAPNGCAGPGEIVVYELKECVDVATGMELLAGSKMQKMKQDDPAGWQAISDTISTAQILGGYVKVRYYLEDTHEGFGRLKAKVMTEGLQSIPYVRMKREVRAHLAAKYYWDVDMVNCQPTIFMQKLQEHRMPCKMLTRYVTEREQCIEEVSRACGVDRKQAKELFLRLMFFGGVAKWVEETPGVLRDMVPSWVYELKDEMRRNAEEMLKHREFSKLKEYMDESNADVSYNETGSLMAMYLQTKERKCMQALVDAMKGDSYVIGGIIYDGVLVRRRENALSDEMLHHWTKAVKDRTGFEVRLVVKEFQLEADWLSRPEASIDEDEAKWDDSWIRGAHLTYEEMKRRWEDRSFKVTKGPNYIREHRDSRTLMKEHDLIQSYRHMTYAEVERGAGGFVSVTEKPFISRWISDNTIRLYENMVLAPPPKIVPATSYNIWSEPAVARYRPKIPVDKYSDGVKMYLDLISVLCCRNESMIKYVLDWVADLFQHPGKKNGIALIMKGEEGVGKNRFTDLLRFMLGEDKFLQTANPSTSIYGQFTQPREGRSLIVINEAKGSDSFSSNDVIKDMITCDQFMCEGKFLNSYVMTSIERYIFTSNNDNPVNVNPDSRRYVVMNVSSEMRGNRGFFETLSMHMDDEHTRHEFYSLLMERDLKGVDWENHRPVTEDQVQMGMMNLPLESKFVKDMVKERYLEGLRQGELLSAISMTFSLEEMLPKFVSWLAEKYSNTTHVTSVERFGKHLSSKLVWDEKKYTGFEAVTKVRTKTKVVYKVAVEAMMREMVTKKWLSREDLM